MKKVLSVLVAVAMLITIVPFGSITASAATYSASSAVSFANSHWNDGVGLCAEFVSRCLAAGGISIPNSAYYSTSQQSYQNNSGTLGSYRNPYTCSAALLLYLSQNYPIITNPSSSQISVGDVVFMYGGSSGQWKDGHVGIVISTSGGVPVYAAHNKATNTGKFSSSYPCTYVAKMNGTITTHKVNSSYGTNFTAYPKSKITAENIFDENHNMVSSTAWIGTTDKCTIYEVYTDGCCKLSYPIDSGGSKTVYSKISLFNTHTHSYTGARLQEPEHPHVITQRCVDYATCGGYIVTGEYGQSKTCQQCWYASFDFSTSSVSLKVGESKTISATINGYFPDTMVGVFDYDTSRIEVTTGQNTITFKGLKTGTCTMKVIIYSDSSKSHIIGSKSVTVTVSDPTYTGRVSFDKSSISLVMPDNKTSTLNIELTGTWPEGAGYTFDYNSNVVSMSQNGTMLTITAKNAGSTNFTINIVNKNNNNALITSAVCPITVKNATYTIKYNANGGNGAPSTQIKTYGTPIRISDVVPKREGFIFKGWTIWASSTTVKYLPGDEITANMDDGTTLTLYAVWEEITLKSIKVNSPDKVLYYMGEYLDTSGLRLRLEYSDGSTSVIDNGYTVSGFDSSFEGRKNVTVSYGGKTDSFEVMVIPSSVSLSEKSITLNLGETKTISAITDPVGCSVKWSVWNNNVVNVSNGKITAVGVGETKIEVTFEWQGYYSFATCDVTVNAVKTLSSISVESKPTKITYEIGESLNTNGLKLKLKYSDGSTETITSGFTTSGFSSTTAGTKTVTVKYGGLTTTFTVTVNPAPVPETSAQLVMSSTETMAGKEVTLTLSIKNNPGVAGLAVSLKYDENVLTLKDSENGDLFSGFTAAKNFAWDESEDVTDDGELATFTFTIAENVPAGEYGVEVIVRSCTNEDLDDVELLTTNGIVSVIDFVYGDSNGDNKIDMKDVVLLRKYITNFDYDTNTSSANVELGADANGDNKIDMKDVVILRKYITNYDYDTESSTVVLGPR